MRPIKVLHVITGLSRGGAESMLHKLVSHSVSLNDRAYAHAVIALNDRNDFDFDGIGVPVTLGKLRGPLAAPAAIYRLRRLAAKLQPDILHGWMYHANVVACLIAPRGTPVLAGIRCTLALTREKPLTRTAIRLTPPLIKAKRGKMIYCSQQSREQHEALGYPSRGGQVIPNGFDCERFSPSAEYRDAVLSELSLEPDAVLVGHAARFHPMKNHGGLLHAFAAVFAEHPHVHLVLAGRDVDAGNPVLAEIIRAQGLSRRVHLLGERQDLQRLLPAFDLYVSSSAWGEAFPNVLGEAMASGVPCVTTDVGDSAEIVGDTGRVVAAGDNAALAEALLDVAFLPRELRQALGARARDRIVRNYGIQRIWERYATLYADSMSDADGSKAS